MAGCRASRPDRPRRRARGSWYELIDLRAALHAAREPSCGARARGVAACREVVALLPGRRARGSHRRFVDRARRQRGRRSRSGAAAEHAVGPTRALTPTNRRARRSGRTPHVGRAVAAREATAVAAPPNQRVRALAVRAAAVGVVAERAAVVAGRIRRDGKRRRAQPRVDLVRRDRSARTARARDEDERAEWALHPQIVTRRASFTCVTSSHQRPLRVGPHRVHTNLPDADVATA